MAHCPICRKTKLELFEESLDEIDGPNWKRYTCKNCGLFIDIREIKDKDILNMIQKE